jgi:hypothetical protein
MLAEEILSQIEVLPVKELLPHEETISLNLKRLKEAMLNIGHLVDPVVIDKKTKLILDGHHRRKVLDLIECPNVTCQTVDYMSDKIKVGSWYPIFDNKGIQDVIATPNLKSEEVDFEAGLKAVNTLQAAYMMCQNIGGKTKSYLLNPGHYKLREMIEEQNFVFSTINGSINWRYVSDDLASSYLDTGSTVLYRRTYSKPEIIKMAQDHTPFPPKSTRHCIPDRIIRLNMKLGWLHEDKDEAFNYLKSMLEKRLYEGNVRRYSEPVIVIY